jgi:hypothetical protein
MSLENLETGDIVLFKATGSADYTNVAVVLSNPSFLTYNNPDFPLEGKYFLSGLSFVFSPVGPDPGIKIYVGGAKINAIAPDYDGNIYFRKLTSNKTQEELNSAMKNFYDTKFINKHTPDVVEYVLNRGGAIGICDNFLSEYNQDTLKLASCSIYYLYTLLGLLDSNMDYNTIGDNYFGDLVNLLDNASLGLLEQYK